MRAEPDLEILGRYAGDHLAGARAATEIAERCADRSDGELEGFLRRFLEEVAGDVAALRTTMDRVDISPPLTRRAMATAGAVVTVARDLLPGGYGPIDRLEDVEALCVGVWGKRLLWSTLLRVADIEPRLRDVPFAELAERAERQERELLAWRDRLAAECLGVEVTRTG